MDHVAQCLPRNRAVNRVVIPSCPQIVEVADVVDEPADLPAMAFHMGWQRRKVMTRSKWLSRSIELKANI